MYNLPGTSVLFTLAHPCQDKGEDLILPGTPPPNLVSHALHTSSALRRENEEKERSEVRRPHPVRSLVLLAGAHRGTAAETELKGCARPGLATGTPRPIGWRGSAGDAKLGSLPHLRCGGSPFGRRWSPSAGVAGPGCPRDVTHSSPVLHNHWAPSSGPHHHHEGQFGAWSWEHSAHNLSL